MRDMEDKEFDDWELSTIMKKGKRTMPFDDFEDKVMDKICQEYSYKSIVAAKLKLSLIFFVIGTVSGIVLTLLFSAFGDSVFGISPKTLAMVVLFIVAVAGILSVDNLLRLIRKYSE